MDVLIGNVPVTEISTLDPGKISTTADTEILGWTKLKKKKKEKGIMDGYWWFLESSLLSPPQSLLLKLSLL